MKVKVLELERKNARTCSAPGCQSRDKTGESKQKPKSKRKQPSDAGEAPNAFRNELLLHLPLKRWTIDASSSNGRYITISSFDTPCLYVQI